MSTRQHGDVTASGAPHSRLQAASGIASRVFVGTAVIVALVVLVALLLASTAARRTADATARRNLDQAVDLVAQLLSGRERSLAGGARVFVQGPYFRTLVAERRRDDILDQTFEAAEQLQASWVFITDATGTLLAKSDEPSAAGDALGAVALIANALRGQVSGGFGVSGDSLLFQVAAVPIALPDAAPIGALMATRVIDALLAADIRSATASEVVFYAIDRAGTAQVVTSTLPVTAALNTSIAEFASPSPLASPTLPSAARHRGLDAEIDGVRWMLQSAALTTSGGEIIGGYAVLRPHDDAMAALTGVRRSLYTAGALGLLLALVATWIAARYVTRPVRALAQAIELAIDGEYSLSAPTSLLEHGRAGEIGSLARAIDALMVDLRDKDSLSVSTAAGLNGGDAPAVHDDADRSVTPTGPWRLLAKGSVLANRYRIDRVIGRGGMGTVYRAHDEVLGETIAIKLLRPDIVVADDRARDALRDELRLARQITHRNVVRTHDIGDSDGIPFLTMEYVEGASLHAVIRSRGKLPVSAVLSLARQLMRAQSAAHEVHIVHGDIKPSNILIGPNGVLKVTDFGIARMMRAVQRVPGAFSLARTEVSGALAGAIVGTPEYLAPELLIGGTPTVASDLYAAGIVLHECLVGTTPYPAETPMAFLAGKLELSGEISSRSVAARASRERAAAGIPLALETLLAELTHPDPAHRPPSPGQVRDLLSRIH